MAYNILVVGTHCDGLREVSFEEAQALASSHDAAYLELTRDEAFIKILGSILSDDMNPE